MTADEEFEIIKAKAKAFGLSRPYGHQWNKNRMFVTDRQQFYIPEYNVSKQMAFDLWFHSQNFEHYTIRGVGMACTTGVIKNK